MHGEGLDEITTTGVTKVAALKDGTITNFELTPADFGLERVSLDALKGGDGAHNAAALQAVLDGAENAYRDISLANAAASLMIAGRAGDLSGRHGAGPAIAFERRRQGRLAAVDHRLERGLRRRHDGYPAPHRSL